MTKEKLHEILILHLAWLRSEAHGVRANLDGANLYGANLTRANLTYANLTRANLTCANLDGANLDGANLTRANLTRANLDGAYLCGAYLCGANLDGANLTRANLEHTNLKILQGYFGKHHAYTTPEYIKIGCIKKSHEEWLEQYKEIGQKEKYTDFEIKMYGNFIKMAIAWKKRLVKDKK